MSTLRSAIAHNASNRDVFPSRVARMRQAEFFNSILRFRNSVWRPGFLSDLFVSKHRDGVKAHGPPCRNKARNRGDCDQHHRDNYQRKRIRGRHAVK